MELGQVPEFLRRTHPGSGDFSRHEARYIGGNTLTLLDTGGEAFRAMWEAIDGARETINLESYILCSDRTGEEFARRLAARSRAGVVVRVIFDSVGSLDIDPVFLTRLRNAGVSIHEYHPVAPWRPRWSWGRRDHRKILVVDGRIGFTGGVNISDVHAPAAEGGSDWRDIHVRIEGPAVGQLDRLFREVWSHETGRWFPSRGHPEHVKGGSRVWVAANQDLLHRFRIRSAYLASLRAAKDEVLIANAYFVPERRTLRALAAAARRGVRVRILVPGSSDVRAVWHAGRFRYGYLLRHGVRLHEWMGPLLHTKAAVVDSTWSAVGSYNLDHRSLLHNLEVNLHTLDRGFSSRLAQRLRQDIESSPEITLERWRRRPFLEKALEAFFYLFRYFL